MSDKMIFKPRKGNSMNETEARNETAEPTKKIELLKPNGSTSIPNTTETLGRTAIKEVPNQISDAQRADMEKVRQHQTKLNKYGAGLEVDGVWGEKTEAASRELYPKYKDRPKSNGMTVRPSRVSQSDVRSKLLGNGETETSKSNASATTSYFKDKSVAKVDSTVAPKVTSKPATKKGSTMTIKNFLNTEGKQAPRNDTKWREAQGKEVERLEKDAEFKRQRVEDSDTATDPNDHIMGSFEEGRAGESVGRTIVTAKRQSDLNDAESRLRTAKEGTNKKSKGIDGVDKAIYAAEAVGPAVGRKMMKSSSRTMKLAGLALSVLPTSADVVKGQLDSDEKGIDVGAATKSVARGVALGTAGSVISGGLRRSAIGAIKEGKEAKIIKGLKREAKGAVAAAETSMASAKTVKAKNAAQKVLAAAKGDLSTAKGMRISEGSSVGENMKKALNKTGVGMVVKAVKNNKIVKGTKAFISNRKDANELKGKQATKAAKAEAKLQRKSGGSTISEKQEAKTMVLKRQAEDRIAAREGERIANRIDGEEQARIQAEHNAANDRKLGITRNDKPSTMQIERESEYKAGLAKERAARRAEAERPNNERRAQTERAITADARRTAIKHEEELLAPRREAERQAKTQAVESKQKVKQTKMRVRRERVSSKRLKEENSRRIDRERFMKIR